MSSKNSNNTDYKKYRLLVERYMSRPLGVSAPHNLGAVSNFPSFEEKHGFGDENHHNDEDDMEMKKKPNMDGDDSSMEDEDHDDDMEKDHDRDMDKPDMDMSNDEEGHTDGDDENNDDDEEHEDEDGDDELDIDVTDDELNSKDNDEDENDDMDDENSEMSSDGEEFGRKHSDMAFMRAVSEWKKNIAKDNESAEIEEKPKKKKKAKMKKDDCVCNETNKDWYESIVRNYTKMSEDKLVSNSKKVPGPGEVGYAPETRIGWGSENQELQETVNALKKKISILEKKLSKKK